MGGREPSLQFPVSKGVSFITPQAKAAAASKQRRLTIATRPPTAPAAAPEQVALRHRASSSTLLLCDFDKTITDYDAGETPSSCSPPFYKDLLGLSIHSPLLEPR